MEEKKVSVTDAYAAQLPRTGEEAVHMHDLASRWGTSERGVRAIIADLRNDGYLVVTNDKGYFISDDVEELKRFYAKSRAKAIGIFKNVKNIRRVLVERGAL